MTTTRSMVPASDSPPARRAMVTGAARGIGWAIARELAADGHAVVGVDLLEPGDRDPFDDFRSGVDLGDPAAIEELVADAGSVDILVNNAALFIHKPLDDFAIDEFDRTIAVNQRGPLLLARALLPHMEEQGWGRVVNITSVGARTGGVSDSCVYNGTKAAIISFTKFLARRVGPHGVTVNAVAPGGIESAMTAHMTPENRARLEAEIPVGRFGDPTDVAGPVAFLCSDRAAYVNGVTLDVNGGWVMV